VGAEFVEFELQDAHSESNDKFICSWQNCQVGAKIFEHCHKMGAQW